jgi:hypothetical protein
MIYASLAHFDFRDYIRKPGARLHSKRSSALSVHDANAVIVIQIPNTTATVLCKHVPRPGKKTIDRRSTTSPDP